MNATRTQTRLYSTERQSDLYDTAEKYRLGRRWERRFFEEREDLARRKRPSGAHFDAFIVMKASTDGKMEKETEGSGLYEVDDAKCRDGQYDIKLDKDFKVIVMTRD